MAAMQMPVMELFVCQPVKYCCVGIAYPVACLYQRNMAGEARSNYEYTVEAIDYAHHNVVCIQCRPLIMYWILGTAMESQLSWLRIQCLDPNGTTTIDTVSLFVPWHSVLYSTVVTVPH